MGLEVWKRSKTKFGLETANGGGLEKPNWRVWRGGKTPNLGAWKRGLEKAKKPNLAAKGQKAKFGCSEEVWKRPKKFGGLEGLDKAKKPNLGLERPGKSQKAKFGGLEKAKKPGLEGLEKAQIWFGKSQIWGLGGGLEKAKSQILGLWKRPKSQILGVWTGFGKRQKPKFGGLEGVWKGKKAKFGGLEGVWKRLKNQIWWLVGQKPNLAVLERSAKSQKTAFGGFGGSGKSPKAKFGRLEEKAKFGGLEGVEKAKKPNLGAWMEAVWKRQKKAKFGGWLGEPKTQEGVWKRLCLEGLEKAKKPNLEAWRASGKGQKAKFGGLQGVWKRPKKPNLGAWRASKKSGAWRGCGKGQKAKFGGLGGVWEPKSQIWGLGGWSLEKGQKAKFGVEGVWKRQKSQIWGLGERLEKGQKAKFGGLGGVWIGGGLEQAKKPNLGAWSSLEKAKKPKWRFRAKNY